MRRMAGSRASLWLVWALCLGLLALELAFAYRVSGRVFAWNSGQTAVAGFVLAMIAMALGVWSFALREALALRELRAGRLDLSTPVGFAQLRTMLYVLWLLCLLIGLLGSALAWGSGSPRSAWPYVAGAAVLLALHAPRAHLFERHSLSS
jgi:cation transport ATPase